MVRLCPFVVLGFSEHPRPRIEKLVKVRTLRDQRTQEAAGCVTQHVEQAAPNIGLLNGKATGRVDVFSRADAVRRHGERRTCEHDHREFATQFFLDATKQLPNVVVALGRWIRIQLLQVCHRADRMIRHRPNVFFQLERQPHRHGECRDVVEENDPIDAETTRAERRLHRLFDVLGELVERQPRADFLKLRIPAPGLSHGPDGWPFDRFATGGTNEQVRGRTRLCHRFRCREIIPSPPVASHQHIGSRCRK